MLPGILSFAPPRAVGPVRPHPKSRQPSGAGVSNAEQHMALPVPTSHVTRPGRVPHDFYPTPSSAVRAFLAAERFEGSIWEPACGDGAIAKELVAHSYDVTATDLIDRGYGRGGVDFLETIWPRGKHIVTNPPYGHGLADAFVTHALKLAAITNGRVAMLLNIASLCHRDRHAFWTERPPSVLYALDDCVCFPEGRPDAATRFTHQHRYVWAVWEPETVPVSRTAFQWLATGPFTERALRQAKRQSKHQQTERTTS